MPIFLLPFITFGIIVVGAVLLAPHAMGKKLVKCPCCGVTAWVDHVSNDH